MDAASPTAASVALGAAVVLCSAFLLGALVAAEVGRRTRLGLAHPAVVWLGLEAVFFGPGSIALALVDGRPGPAIYVAGAIVAVGAGAGGSAWLAARRVGRAERGATAEVPGTAEALGTADVPGTLAARATAEVPGTAGSPATAEAPGTTEVPGTAVSAGMAEALGTADVPATAGSAGMAEPTPRLEPTAPSPTAPSRRPVVVGLLLAGLGLAAIAPDLIEHGLPLLVTDITGARVELSGLAVQPLRVAWPALAALCLFGAAAPASRLRRLAGLVGLGVVVGAETLLASRYLLAELVLTLLLAWWIAGRRLPRRVALGLVLVGLAVFVGLGAVRIVGTVPGRELEVTVERTVSRLLLVQPRTLAALQDAIPAETDYFGGLTWLRRLGPLLGRDDIPNLGYWIYPRVVPEPQPVPGYAAPGLLGEGWANFGPAGLGLFVLLGVGVERLGALVALVRRRGGSVADLVAASLVILFVARTHALGLNGLAVLLALVVLWRLLADAPRGLAGDVAAVLRWRA